MALSGNDTWSNMTEDKRQLMMKWTVTDEVCQQAPNDADYGNLQ